MKLMILAAMGGAIGAAARYAVSVGATRFIGHGFPWGTLAVNVIGCLIMGSLVEAIALKYSVSQEVRTFLFTGILGGFTTFSAFSLDFATLVERKEHVMAGLYLGASVGLSIFALFAGLAMARAVIQ
jgi:CrcB protein